MKYAYLFKTLYYDFDKGNTLDNLNCDLFIYLSTYLAYSISSRHFRVYLPKSILYSRCDFLQNFFHYPNKLCTYFSDHIGTQQFVMQHNVKTSLTKDFVVGLPKHHFSNYGQ